MLSPSRGARLSFRRRGLLKQLHLAIDAQNFRHLGLKLWVAAFQVITDLVQQACSGRNALLPVRAREHAGREAASSFVREPEGNGVAERFIRTLKENLLWVRTFKTIEELRAELVAFARHYNETWLVARHGYKTPAKVREEQTTPRIAIDPTLAATLPLAA